MRDAPRWSGAVGLLLANHAPDRSVSEVFRPARWRLAELKRGPRGIDKTDRSGT